MDFPEEEEEETQKDISVAAAEMSRFKDERLRSLFFLVSASHGTLSFYVTLFLLCFSSRVLT